MVIILHRGIQENILKVLFNLVKMPQFHYLKAATEFHKTLRIAIFFPPCLFIFKKSKIQGFSQTFRYIEKAKRLYIACFLDMLFFFRSHMMRYWNLGIITYKYWFMLPRKGCGKILFFLKFYLNSQQKQKKVSLKLY